jgi:hypothetical protein
VKNREPRSRTYEQWQRVRWNATERREWTPSPTALGFCVGLALGVLLCCGWELPREADAKPAAPCADR